MSHYARFLAKRLRRKADKLEAKPRYIYWVLFGMALKMHNQAYNHYKSDTYRRWVDYHVYGPLVVLLRLSLPEDMAEGLAQKYPNKPKVAA